MTKKNTSIWIEPSVLKRLKMLSVEREKPIGDIIEGLVNFSESGPRIRDETFQERFQYLLDNALENSGMQGGWVKPDEIAPGENSFDHARRKTKEARAAQAQEAKTERDSLDK